MDDEGRIGGERRARQVGSGIGVSEVPTDRTAISDLHVADLPGGRRERRRVLGHLFGVNEIAVSRHRADREPVTVGRDTLHRLDIADVDQDVGTRQSSLHRRQQTVAAGEQFRRPRFRVFVEQIERVVDAVSVVVVELVGIHQFSPPSSSIALPSAIASSPPSAPASGASFTARQTASFVSGMSM